MTKNVDLMSPDASPALLKKTGVRRVNNLPLFIVIGVLTVFLALIAVVAMKRANQQQMVQEPTKTIQHMDSATMADEIVAGRTGGIINPPKPIVPVETRIALPIAKIDNPDEPPVLHHDSVQLLDPADPDLERIKMEKTQEFEDAVKAQMNIALPSQLKESSNDLHQKGETQARLDEVQRRLEQMNSDDVTGSYQARLQQIRAAMTGGTQGSINNTSLLREASLNTVEQGDRWALNQQVDAPKTPFVLRAGGIIPGLMVSGIKSGLPGPIIGQVSEDVYDTATGKYLLIPQGTQLFGVYSNEVLYGQDSILIAWQRMTFPDGKALDIGSMPGADSAGYAGFRDQVNNHYVRIFGSALLMSGVVGGVALTQNPSGQGPYGQPMQPTATSVMSEALGQQLGQVTAQMIAKNLNIAPDLKIRSAYPFNIIVVKDITFTKPYSAFDY